MGGSSRRQISLLTCGHSLCTKCAQTRRHKNVGFEDPDTAAESVKCAVCETVQQRIVDDEPSATVLQLVELLLKHGITRVLTCVSDMCDICDIGICDATFHDT